MSEQLQQMQEILQKSLIKIKKLELELAQAKENIALPKEPIAIIGTGVRLAGSIDSTKKLWNLLSAQRSVFSKIPKDRFDVDAIYSADVSIPGKTVAQFGAFLDNDVRAFDADFFGISPREAKSIDPLQRMILEVVYEAIENAGIASDTLKGSNTGVYIALGNSDYIQARFRSGSLDTVDVYDTTGIPFGTACGRVSYLYDLKGTSFALDAACASSLLAVHLANEDLNKKIIDTAIVASANLLLTPEPFVGLSKLGSLSPNDACNAFANDANGYVRGEGCGVVLLKRLQDATNDNDNIEAIIKGSAVKHNGRSNGFTAPNPEIQIETIKEALKNAELSVNDIDYVEAHGIGNRFTDALEIQAIQDAYTGRAKPIYVGSVKANIGHLEAGTGMPMIFKVIEILKHQQIPAQINIAALNEDVDWNTIQAKVNTESIKWQSDIAKPMLAAINLSGYSGTNVHMIFEAAPPKSKSDEVPSPLHFVLSAKDAHALKSLANKYLSETDWQENSLTEICFTLQNHRNNFDYKLSIVANNKQAIIEGLTDFVQDIKSEKYAVSQPSLNRNKEVVFMFTGQGAQYFGMCKSYYDTFDIFKQTIDECDEMMKSALQISIKDILWNDSIDKNLIHQTKYTQAALFVVEYASAKLWMSFGVHASALIGHSIGEIVALTIANAIDLKDAVQLVIARAALMNSLPMHEGSMASVFCNEETLQPFLENSNVNLAAVNSIKNCTISGKKEDVATFVAMLQEHKIKAVPLQVSHAFHSYLMEPIVEKFTIFAQQFSFKQPAITVVSNLTGKEITKADLSAAYFANHIRHAIQFAKGVDYLQKNNYEVYIEVGPNPVLISLAKQSNTNSNALWLPSAKREENDITYFHKTLQQLYCADIKINWSIFYLHKKINRVALPSYAWNQKVYWENPVRQAIHFAHSSNTHTSNNKIEIHDSNYQTASTNTQTIATRETLLAYMQIEAAKVLGLEAGQKVDINKPYREQGFDSMMSGEYLSLMEKHIGAELKMEIIHQYNTPKDLHQYLIDTYYGGGTVDTTQAITMADIMFNQEMEHSFQGDWHEIQATDNALMRWFKKIDKKLPTVKN